jgi:hypothetical protein
MRKIILTLAIAAAFAAPVAFAGGGHGGGGIGIGVGGGGHIGGGIGGPVGGVRGGVDVGGSVHGSDRGLGRQGVLDRATTPEQAVFGLSTAERASLLRDADLATRKAFGKYQSALAKARAKRDHAEHGTDAMLSAEAASRQQIASFGADTAARARELQDADRATRRAFGKFQSTLAREQQLTVAAGAEAEASAFGQDTAARAQMLGQADVSTRRQFGADQSTRARAQDRNGSDETVHPDDRR